MLHGCPLCWIIQRTDLDNCLFPFPFYLPENSFFKFCMAALDVEFYKDLIWITNLTRISTFATLKTSNMSEQCSLVSLSPISWLSAVLSSYLAVGFQKSLHIYLSVFLFLQRGRGDWNPSPHYVEGNLNEKQKWKLLTVPRKYSQINIHKSYIFHFQKNRKISSVCLIDFSVKGNLWTPPDRSAYHWL